MATATKRTDRPHPAFRPRTATCLLWAVALAALVGDLATTIVGLEMGLTESNPVAAGFIEDFGYVGMVALKAAAVAIAVLVGRILPRHFDPIIPTGLAVPWLLAVSINTVALTGAMA